MRRIFNITPRTQKLPPLPVLDDITDAAELERHGEWTWFCNARIALDAEQSAKRMKISDDCWACDLFAVLLREMKKRRLLVVDECTERAAHLENFVSI